MPVAESPLALWGQLLAGLPHLATLSFEFSHFTMADREDGGLHIQRVFTTHLASLAVALQAADRVVQVRVRQAEWTDTVNHPNMPVVTVLDRHLVL